MVMDSYEHSQIGHGKEEEGEGGNGGIKYLILFSSMYRHFVFIMPLFDSC